VDNDDDADDHQADAATTPTGRVFPFGPNPFTDGSVPITLSRTRPERTGPSSEVEETLLNAYEDPDADDEMARSISHLNASSTNAIFEKQRVSRAVVMYGVCRMELEKTALEPVRPVVLIDGYW